MFDADVSSRYYEIAENPLPEDIVEKYADRKDKFEMDSSGLSELEILQINHFVLNGASMPRTSVTRRMRNGFTDLCHCGGGKIAEEEVNDDVFKHPYGKLMP
jgi:hypothetical protein